MQWIVAEFLRLLKIIEYETNAPNERKQIFRIDQINNLREIQAMRRLSPHDNIVELKEVLL